MDDTGFVDFVGELISRLEQRGPQSLTADENHLLQHLGVPNAGATDHTPKRPYPWAASEVFLNYLLDKFEAKGPASLRPMERRFLAASLANEGRPVVPLGDPEDPAFRREFCAAAREYLPSREALIVDHRWELEKQAALLSDAEEPIAALVLYATWLEHWLNGVLARQARRFGMTDEDRKQMLRDVSMRAKLGWVFRLFQLPALDAEIVKDFFDVTETRNGYVHYKWSFKELGDEKEEKTRLRRIVAKMPSMLSMLRDYEQRTFYTKAYDVAQQVFGSDLFGRAAKEKE